MMDENKYFQKLHGKYYDFLVSGYHCQIPESSSEALQETLLLQLLKWCEINNLGNETDLVGEGLLATTRMFIEQRHGFTSSKQTAKYLRNWAVECEQSENLVGGPEFVLKGIREATRTNSRRYSCLCDKENSRDGKPVKCIFPTTEQDPYKLLEGLSIDEW